MRKSQLPLIFTKHMVAKSHLRSNVNCAFNVYGIPLKFYMFYVCYSKHSFFLVNGTFYETMNIVPLTK